MERNLACFCVSHWIENLIYHIERELRLLGCDIVKGIFAMEVGDLLELVKMRMYALRRCQDYE